MEIPRITKEAIKMEVQSKNKLIQVNVAKPNKTVLALIANF